MRRIPSFNDFSPTILKGDIRPCLQIVKSSGGDRRAVVREFAKAFFDGKENVRAKTNVLTTLRSTGLIDAKTLALTDIGEKVLNAPTAVEASQLFCTHLIKSANGDVLLQAISDLKSRGEAITKVALQRALVLRGIEGLSNATTDHTTLKNWMVHAGILDASNDVNDKMLKRLTGISTVEKDEFSGLTSAQQFFLRLLRMRHVTEQGPFLVSHLLGECVDSHPDQFQPASFAAKVREPLVAAGWITVTGLGSGPQGGKSGHVAASAKLLSIPLDQLSPSFSGGIPSDLMPRLNVQRADIRRDLSAGPSKKGLALELLALKMIIDLGLEGRGFRTRSSSQTAHAEVDLTAEGRHLLFSRWLWQCKNTNAKVRLDDVAKEVGLAIFARAHVVAVVTTSDFTADAKRYAEEISRSTHLQFLLIPGRVVREYLDARDGRTVLRRFAEDNAAAVMNTKAAQPLDPSLPTAAPPA